MGWMENGLRGGYRMAPDKGVGEAKTEWLKHNNFFHPPGNST